MVHSQFGWPASSGRPARARAVGFLCVLALATPSLAPCARAQAQANYEALETFTSLLNVIRSEYVDSLSVADLVRAAMDGLVRSLDPYSRLVPRDVVAREVALERGDLGTLGITLEPVDGLPTVLSVVDGGPAERAGVTAGDRLASVNDTSAVGADVAALAIALARPPGTRVRLEVERGPRTHPERFQVTIETAVLRARSVTLERMLDEQVGYVRLADFRPGAPEEVARVVEGLQRRGAVGVLLDLRGNPGGRVTSSVEVASLFLPRHSVVFRTRGRRSEGRDYATLRDGRFGNLPLVLLTDAHTASAAEALAGSLQDHRRALIVGERTFGKALILEPSVLPNGDVVWLTVGRVLTPNGRFIQRPYAVGEPASRSDAGRSFPGEGGIQPDVLVGGAITLPVWFSMAVDRGLTVAVADSVAATLPASEPARDEWTADPERWDRDVTTPLLARVRDALGDPGAVTPEVRAAVSRRLAARVVEVRWGEAARDDFLLRYDPAIRVATAQFARLPSLLVPSDN